MTILADESAPLVIRDYQRGGMKMNDASVTIAAMEAREACKGESDILERIKKAMKACRGHWMETSETGQFRAAVSAAMLESEGDERDRIERSAKALSRMNALLQALHSGVPVDVEAMAAEKQDEDLIPLMKIWREAA